MTMAVYQNAEIRKGGNTIRVNVSVDAYIPLATELVEWDGKLLPPNNIGLVLGETYMLFLPDCSPAKIEITSEADQVDRVVTFKGVGEPPKAKPAKEVHSAK
jgi:hypothetical protein